jgi:hypothetical protein
MKISRSLLLLICISSVCSAADKFDYRVLATSKTSTMEKELNEAGEAGYSMVSVMGGGTAFGGKEVLLVMARKTDDAVKRRHFKLLATSKTSTLEKELQAAGAEGFEYRGETVFESAFGGKEVSVILEQSSEQAHRGIDYKVLATSKTSTLQKELLAAGEQGYECMGMMVGKTALGGSETISILRKYRD